jgi:hypothetical protein
MQWSIKVALETPDVETNNTDNTGNLSEMVEETKLRILRWGAYIR